MSSRPGALKRFNHWRIRKGRELRNLRLLAWYRFAYERKRPRLSLSGLTECRTVGLMMLGNGIGDAIVVSGFISALRKAGKEVHCICNKKTAGILTDMIETDGLHVLPDRPKRKDVLRLHLSFDAVILFGDPDKNLHRDMRVLTAIGHRYAVGYNQKDTRFFDLNIIRDEKGCHWSERLRDGAARLGVPIENFTYDLHFSDECQREVDEFAAGMGKQGFVIFNPVASDKFRSLSPAFIMETLGWLTSHSSRRVVVFNVRNEDLAKDFPDAVFAPFDALDRSIALVGKCACLITVDTSFVHAARFFNVSMIGIYNNRLACNRYDNNVQWGPGYDKAVQVFSDAHVNTETGDDLRDMPFEILEKALEECEALR